MKWYKREKNQEAPTVAQIRIGEMENSEWNGHATSYFMADGKVQNEWLRPGQGTCQPLEITKPEDAFFGTGLPYNKEPEKPITE